MCVTPVLRISTTSSRKCRASTRNSPGSGGSGCASSSVAGEASPVYPILYCRRLLQQFVVDTYIKIESSNYIFHHQKELRKDLYFIGGPRDKLCRYLDAMALVRKGGSTIEEERLKK